MRGRQAQHLAAAAALVAIATPLGAQQADPNQAVKDETARIVAETALENAKSDHAKAEAARVQALGLPSFEGKTDLGSNAGTMEVNLLASRALGAAADHVAGAAGLTGDPILLSGDEVVDFGAADAMTLQMQAIEGLYLLAGIRKPAPAPVEADGQAPAGGALPVAIAAISAVAGLLRAETTVTGADAAAVTQQMFVAAVAARLTNHGHHAILPAALVSGVSVEGKKLYAELNALSVLRDLAEKREAVLAAIEKPTNAQKSELASISTATSRHDAFLAKVTVADDKGVVPLAAAARLAGVLGSDRQILRVYVNKAGGSIVNTKNIATTFGLDPVKISGGVVVSYVLSTPTSGKVDGADVLSCDTTLTSMRAVQERKWEERRPSAIRSTLCRSVL